MENKTLLEVSSSKCFEGYQKVYSHVSDATKCVMKFSIFLPPQVKNIKCPVLYYLSGLTCTEENFITKSGFQKYASQHGIVVVGSDTSPRGCDIQGEDDDFCIGTGAGFYLDADTDNWKLNYRMYSYVTKELPSLIEMNFPVIQNCQSIFGHSMGGHGALICILKNPNKYKSVSAFSPITNPINSTWGAKAFNVYLGSDRIKWKQWDSCELMKVYSAEKHEILIDQGTRDQFLEELGTESFAKECKLKGMPLTLRYQPEYDHGYYFISTFIEDHILHHKQYLYS